jgi:predicted hydrocarbon binding protein
MAVDESVTVKGTPVRSLQKFIDAELTPDQREEAFRALPPDLAVRLRSPILATETIPVHALNLLTEEAARVKGEPLEVFARRAGRAGAGDAVRGIYRFFALVLTPSALLGKASLMWTSLYNRGELKVADQSSNGATIRLTGFPAEPAGCARISGWIERLAEMTGVRNIVVQQTKCNARGDGECEWRLTWT